MSKLYSSESLCSCELLDHYMYDYELLKTRIYIGIQICLQYITDLFARSVKSAFSGKIYGDGPARTDASQFGATHFRVTELLATSDEGRSTS